MITNLRESKARLSELVARAASGEEILITVRGKPKARLVPAGKKSGAGDFRKWAAELRRLHRGGTGRTKASSSRKILDELREDRW